MTWWETTAVAFLTVLAFNYLVYTAGYFWHKGKINAIKEK